LIVWNFARTFFIAWRNCLPLQVHRSIWAPWSWWSDDDYLHNLVLFSGYIYIYIGVVWIESKLSMLLVIQSMVVEERSNASYITSNLHAFV
jgi:hypothetical protein